MTRSKRQRERAARRHRRVANMPIEPAGLTRDGTQSGWGCWLVALGTLLALLLFVLWNTAPPAIFSPAAQWCLSEGREIREMTPNADCTRGVLLTAGQLHARVLTDFNVGFGGDLAGARRPNHLDTHILAWGDL